MGGVGGILGLLLAVIGLVLAIPFLVPIQMATNATSSYIDTGAPLDAIFHGAPIWTILLIGVCVLIIFVGAAKRG